MLNPYGWHVKLFTYFFILQMYSEPVLCCSTHRAWLTVRGDFNSLCSEPILNCVHPRYWKVLWKQASGLCKVTPLIRALQQSAWTFPVCFAAHICCQGQGRLAVDSEAVKYEPNQRALVRNSDRHSAQKCHVTLHRNVQLSVKKANNFTVIQQK